MSMAGYDGGSFGREDLIVAIFANAQALALAQYLRGLGAVPSRRDGIFVALYEVMWSVTLHTPQRPLETYIINPLREIGAYLIFDSK
jgi:hypothetical protein